MKNIYLLLALILLVSCAKDDDMDNVIEEVKVRYVDDSFVEITVTENIKCGNNNSLVGINKDLFLSVYEPADDSINLRPTIVLAHGGAFVSGSKSQLDGLCRAYARKGFVAVTIDYRLIDDRFISDSIRFSEAVVLTIGDMKAAIRFMRNDALNQNSFGVDPDMMFAGGVSAGAVMANHIGFWDKSEPVPDYLQTHIDNNGGFEGNTNSVEASSEVKGIISFSGSLLRENWIDANDPPIFMVHEEFDQVVPCGYEASVLFPFEVLAYGACRLKPKADEVGVENEYVFLEGLDTHVGYLSEEDENSQTYIDASAAFLAKIIAK